MKLIRLHFQSLIFFSLFSSVWFAGMCRPYFLTYPVPEYTCWVPHYLIAQPVEASLLPRAYNSWRWDRLRAEQRSWARAAITMPRRRQAQRGARPANYKKCKTGRHVHYQEGSRGELCQQKLKTFNNYSKTTNTKEMQAYENIEKVSVRRRLSDWEKGISYCVNSYNVCFRL